MLHRVVFKMDDNNVNTTEMEIRRCLATHKYVCEQINSYFQTKLMKDSRFCCSNKIYIYIIRNEASPPLSTK